ncbi:MAG: hypothetical protein J7M17_08675 [Anaerolineae bacterium]|nr:hypothetical protein [Anaerolineae bacterium]
MTTISIGKGLLGITAFLVACGLALGLTLGNVDLTNPITSLSESRRAEVETQRVAQQNDIDLQQYAVLQAAHTQAEMARLEEETRHLQQIHEQEIRHLQRVREQEIRQIQEQAALKSQLLQMAGYAVIAVLGLSLLAIVAGFSVYIVKRIFASVAKRTAVLDPERKWRMIQAARQREREYRQRELTLYEIPPDYSELFSKATPR